MNMGWMNKAVVVGLAAAIIMAITIGMCLLVFGPSEYITPPPNRGDFEAEIFDGDLGPGENYINENLEIRFWPTLSNIGHVGDPTTGLSADVSNLTRNWGSFTADVKGQENYDNMYVEKSGYWTISVSQSAYIRWHLNVSVSTTGILGVHMTAYLSLWPDNDNNETNGYGAEHEPLFTIWDENDEIKFEMWSGGNRISMEENEKTIYGENRIQ